MIWPRSDAMITEILRQLITSGTRPSIDYSTRRVAATIREFSDIVVYQLKLLQLFDERKVSDL